MTNLRYCSDEASLINEDYGIHTFGPGDTSDCGSDWQGGFDDELETSFDEVEGELDELAELGDETSGESKESADQFAARVDRQ